jgi:hypothetical protein
MRQLAAIGVCVVWPRHHVRAELFVVEVNIAVLLAHVDVLQIRVPVEHVLHVQQIRLRQPQQQPLLLTTRV